jgi:tetratricopeptide (TPR) repeat protein
MDLYLSYRSAEAWPEMVRLYEALPADLRDSVVARQQLAMALNRRKDPGDEDRAIATLENLAATTGDSAETYGLLGRIYKDRYRSAVERGDRLQAAGFLDQAIGAYTHGFEAEPADYYPGVNAISLLVQKDTDEARAEVDRLVPLVTFAAVRKGGAESSDYWTVATVLELAIVGHDEQLAARVLPRVLTTPADSFMLTTTADNLAMLLERRRDTAATGFLEQAVAALRDAADGTS